MLVILIYKEMVLKCITKFIDLVVKQSLKLIGGDIETLISLSIIVYPIASFYS